MTITGVTDVSSQTSGTQQTQGNSVMGKDDFLKLLVAQLKNQDPLNPADSTAFTAQLAQFSSLEQLQNINDSLSSFKSSQSATNNIQSADFIGKTVTATGSSFSVADGKADPIRFDLNNNADNVYLQVYDKYGNFVTDIQAGALKTGEQAVNWDAHDSNGTAVSDGTYTFTVMAMDNDGSTVGSTSYTSGVVTGIDYHDGDAKLMIHDREIPLSSVIRLEEPENQQNS
jgi:flagellar basal-body rod modification protein FlgD